MMENDAVKKATSFDRQPRGVDSIADSTISQKKGTTANFLLRLSSTPYSFARITIASSDKIA
jgi:hypothetical protein